MKEGAQVTKHVDQIVVAETVNVAALWLDMNHWNQLLDIENIGVLPK